MGPAPLSPAPEGVVPCPFCAEPIQSAAFVCRFCGRALPLEAFSVTHRGRRFGTGGLRQGGYGVWDLTLGGEPLARFLQWENAWQRYTDLERGAPSPTGPRTEEFGSTIAVLIGGGLLALGSFLPWLQASVPLIGSISRNGLDGGGDGIITLLLGVVTLIIGAVRMSGSQMPPVLQKSPVVTGIAAVVLVVIDGVSVSERVSDVSSAGASASIGYGLYVCGLGGVLAIIGGLGLRASSRRS